MQPEATWYIVHVNPQCEAKAAAEIRRAGFRAYLPQSVRSTIHHRTKRLILKRRPALVGYIFMRFPAGRPNWYALRQCQGVKGVLYADGKPYALAQQAVAAIMRAQRAATYDTATARSYRLAKRDGERESLARSAVKSRFQRGMHVASTSGPLANIIARIERITRRGTIEAIASIMGREVPVEFTELHDLEIAAPTLAPAAEAA